MSQLPILSAEKIFEYCKVHPNLNEWRPLAGLDTDVFDKLILEPMHRFAEVVQLAPASESHHHAGPGGLFAHTVDVITIALKKRRGYQLPLGGTISEINEQRHLWTMGIFVACLLHDVGKLSATIRLLVKYKNGTERLWNTHTEILPKLKAAVSYRIVFEKTPYEYHHKVALTHFEILPRVARSWLFSAPQVMSEVCAYLWGDRFESGIIGEIAEFADGESTARNLLIPADHRFSNAIPAIDRYLKMIRHWIAENAIRINVNGGMGWVDQQGHLYLVCRSLADKLIQECEGQGLKNLPQDPVRIYDILQEHGYALPTKDGKAIWNINIATSTFSHKLTCLKFEARKFSSPSKVLKPLEGEITIGSEEGRRAPLQANEHSSISDHQNEAGLVPATETTTHEPGKQAPTNANDDQPLASEAATSDPADEYQDSIIDSDTPIRSRSNNDTSSLDTSNETAGKVLREYEEKVLVPVANIQSEKHLDWEAGDTGDRFLQWLKKGLIEKTILINNVNAEVHIVEEGVFLLAPAIFKTFLNRHGLNGESLHKNMSKRFARLRVNIRTNDMNVQPYWVFSNNRATKIQGWLLPFSVIYENDYPIPKPNKFIRKNLEDKNAD
ncbi:helicase [Cellvibrio zantedeschiae]|uniref:Helicase n=1 Tax=Cellvibrio zantedeschiae TaxID=1237077 RepID=A0ABQ3B4W9_9GAMM|nr:MobH family relaxase [Cellvibrio zantedeschiae]GGY79074.1 helicase [Cellvibrio zantedeschiae]